MEMIRAVIAGFVVLLCVMMLYLGWRSERRWGNTDGSPAGPIRLRGLALWVIALAIGLGITAMCGGPGHQFDNIRFP